MKAAVWRVNSTDAARSCYMLARRRCSPPGLRRAVEWCCQQQHHGTKTGIDGFSLPPTTVAGGPSTCDCSTCLPAQWSPNAFIIRDIITCASSSHTWHHCIHIVIFCWRIFADSGKWETSREKGSRAFAVKMILFVTAKQRERLFPTDTASLQCCAKHRWRERTRVVIVWRSSLTSSH